METLLLSLLAVTLIVVSAAQFVGLGLSAGRANLLAHYRRQQELRSKRQAAEIARLNSELQTPATASATPWRVMEVAEICDESDDCRSFYLVDPYQQPLPAFRPGQHLLVRPALAGAYQTTRCYSLSSSPDSRYWRITVKRQTSAPAAARRAAGGGLSGWLHQSIGVGDCLLVGGPSGQFFLAEDNPRPLVLLAAGVGITPMASMLRWSLENTPSRPVRLFYQAQDQAHWAFGPSLHSWQMEFPELQVHSYFSRLAASDWTDNPPPAGRYHTGKFTAEDILNDAAQTPCDYFLCGPNAWMDSLRAGLEQAGVAAHHIHWESFGGPAHPTAPQPSDTSVPTPQSGTALPVRFAHSQVDLEWQDPKQSLWELARAHQLDLPSGCLSGCCGCCRVKVLAGEVETFRDVNIELDDDECLTCISRPKTALTLDV